MQHAPRTTSPGDGPLHCPERAYVADRIGNQRLWKAWSTPMHKRIPMFMMSLPHISTSFHRYIFPHSMTISHSGKPCIGLLEEKKPDSLRRLAGIRTLKVEGGKAICTAPAYYGNCSNQDCWRQMRLRSSTGSDFCENVRDQ